MTEQVMETQSFSALGLSGGPLLWTLDFTRWMKVPIKHRHVARSTIAYVIKEKL